MVNAISAVLAFMPAPPFTATDRLLGARQGAERLLLMNAAADGPASPDQSPAILCYNVMPRLGVPPSRPRSSRRSPRHGRWSESRRERLIYSGGRRKRSLTTSTPEPEGGARCVSSARRDLCGGRGAILVPTATNR